MFSKKEAGGAYACAYAYRAACVRLDATACDRGKGIARARGRTADAASRVEYAACGVSRVAARNKGAEREGFEPSVGLLPHRFSRPAQSAALAPLRIASFLLTATAYAFLFEAAR